MQDKEVEIIEYNNENFAIIDQIDDIICCTKPVIKPNARHMLFPPMKPLNYQPKILLNHKLDNF